MILSSILDIFNKLLIVQIIFLFFMSSFRLVFFFYYNDIPDISIYYLDLFHAFVLGMRIDLVVLAYIQAPLTIVLIILYYVRNNHDFQISKKIISYYLLVFYTLVTVLLISDFGFYSYFKDHINILYFGLFEDDTYALALTVWENYNVLLIVAMFVFFIFLLHLIISKILNKNNRQIALSTIKINPLFIFFIFIILNFLAIRGTTNMYPLVKMIPNVSENLFINNLSQNGVIAFMRAYKIKRKFSNDKYNLIASTGFENNIKKAFEIYTNKNDIYQDKLLSYITHKIPKKENLKDYNVVVIMVESFGLPIREYQSKEFNIMGALEKHFNEDTLFKNCISSGNGTIASLESLLLNIPYRPGSFAFSQSKHKQTSYKHAPAFVFKDNGYDTTFIYGGDLSWREMGKFIKYQGFDKTIGKISIYKSIENKNDYFHPWGIYDEYLYNSIFQRLQNSQKKQFIFALSTNNHPPYNIPKQYKLNNLQISPDLNKHITSKDKELMRKRFQSYSYALDSLGKFIHRIKNSKYAQNTIIAITADNNTIEANMKYEKNTLFKSRNIPFYLYLPQKLKNTLTIDTQVFASHKDIFPTLYNIALNDTKYISIGQNMLDADALHIGFNASQIVSSKSKVIKVDKLDHNNTLFEANYYRASLAITQYLLNQYSVKKSENE